MSNLRKENALRVCMVAYTFYEADNRVRRYAETLAKRNDHVEVIALRRKGQVNHEILNGVEVFRIQERKFNEKSKLSYLYRLLLFFVNSSILLTKRHFIKPYNLIHVHSVPDFEVFAAWFPKLKGAKIILDIHDIVPEFYASKFNVSRNSFIFKSLILVERNSISFSDHVIISNHLWEAILTSRSVRKDKCSTILNYPDLSIFYKRPRTRKDNKFIILYHGTLNMHQGLDIAIKAFDLIKDQIPEAELHIYGQGGDYDLLKDLISQFNLGNKVFLKNFMPIDKIANVIVNADLGIVPKRANSFGNDAFSTKILEFMALGIPVLISDTRIDKYYFNDTMVKFFKSEDEKDLAWCILKMKEDSNLRKYLVENSSLYIEENNWGVKKYKYLELVDTLTENYNDKYAIRSA